MTLTGAATGPLLDLYLARDINRVHGGPVIAAWEVRYLDEATLDMFWSLRQHVSISQAAVRQIENAKAHHRKQFTH